MRRYGAEPEEEGAELRVWGWGFDRGVESEIEGAWLWVWGRSYGFWGWSLAGPTLEAECGNWGWSLSDGAGLRVWEQGFDIGSEV